MSSTYVSYGRARTHDHRIGSQRLILLRHKGKMLIQLHVCSTTQFINSDVNTRHIMSYLTTLWHRTYHNCACCLLFKVSKRNFW